MIKQPEVILNTQRLTLRQFTLNDISDLYAFTSDDEVMKQVGWKTHTCLTDSADVIMNTFNTSSDWAIVLKAENKVIGSINISDDIVYKDKNNQMISFVIARPYWKKGYAYEAAIKVVEYAFEITSLSQLAAYHYPGNKSSEALIKKLGFTYREYLSEATTSYANEKLDLMSYSMDRETYQKEYNEH